jgi:predicted metallo-beta-lactamase superfamily hydrolase
LVQEFDFVASRYPNIQLSRILSEDNARIIVSSHALKTCGYLVQMMDKLFEKKRDAGARL